MIPFSNEACLFISFSVAELPVSRPRYTLLQPDSFIIRTVSLSKPVTRERASGFGILKIDDHRQITHFVEKPSTDKVLDELFTPTEYLGLEEKNLNYIASMGIYVFKKDVLIEVLENNQKEDFGRQVITDAIASHKVFAYVFNGYWEDIGTIKAFFEANLDFANPMPRFNFYDEEAPIYTRKRFLPGSKIENAEIHYSLISDGAIIQGSKLSNTVIGNRSIIRQNANFERVVMMGADFYEMKEMRQENVEIGRCPVGVGFNSVNKNAILDKNVRIGNNVRLVNEKSLRSFRHEKYHIVDGITVVPKNTEIPDGFSM